MSTATGQEVINELFLATATAGHRDTHTQSAISQALGGHEAEEIILSDDDLKVKEKVKRHHEESAGEGSDRLHPIELEGDKVDLLSSVPDMWSWPYIGLYCQYASVGLLYGASGTLLPLCVYNFNGASNVCANAKNIVNFAWSFKVGFAMLTDCYRPFGMRRKPWMILGWSLVLVMLLVLALTAEDMDVSSWLVSLLFVQAFLMLSDVPADGYCVELGRLEPIERRGQILATGQRIRFTFCIVAGVLQTFLLNGPDTNASDCPISFENCWSWGLTANQYYAVLFSIVFILTIPILWLKELPPAEEVPHSFHHYLSDLWQTLQNLTTFYLLVYVIGANSLTNFTNNATITLQYYVIQLTNFQSGLDTITTYTGLVIAIWIFQKYLINRNWRVTQLCSTCFAAILHLVWIAPFYNAGGLRDPWFTIFIDLDTNFVQGISQVLYSMAVIELALPGQEATTYELIVTTGNAALTLNGVIGTQLLTPMKATSCEDDDSSCATSSDSVDVTTTETYTDSDGPYRFTCYTLVLVSISIVASFIFTRFLPSSKEECREWKEKGEALGTSRARGRLAIFLSLIVIAYGVTAAILLLNVDTSCLPEVGGSGC